jgi:hypothetical protein
MAGHAATETSTIATHTANAKRASVTALARLGTTI